MAFTRKIKQEMKTHAAGELKAQIVCHEPTRLKNECIVVSHESKGMPAFDHISPRAHQIDLCCGDAFMNKVGCKSASSNLHVFQSKFQEREDKPHACILIGDVCGLL